MFGNIITGLAKVALSPLKGAVKVIEDISGKNGEENQMIGIGTLGVASALKGTAQGVKEGVEEIFDDE